MKYAVVINGVITEYRNYDYVPTGLKLVNDVPMLRPVVFVPAVGYDGRKHTKNVSTSIGDIQITETETLVDIPLDKIKKSKIRGFKELRDAAFSTAYDLIDMAYIMRGLGPAAKATKLDADLAALTGAYKTAVAAVNAATTADDVLAVDMIVPTL